MTSRSRILDIKPRPEKASWKRRGSKRVYEENHIHFLQNKCLLLLLDLDGYEGASHVVEGFSGDDELRPDPAEADADTGRWSHADESFLVPFALYEIAPDLGSSTKKSR